MFMKYFANCIMLCKYIYVNDACFNISMETYYMWGESVCSLLIDLT